MKRLITKLLGGHIRIGRLTVYGFNAMHVAINWRGKQNYWCFHPPIWWFGRKWPWYFYVSPNATPWAAIYAVGPGVSEIDKGRALQRMRLTASTRLLDEEEMTEIIQLCERMGNEKLEPLERSEDGLTEEEINRILRAFGYDPSEVGKRMQMVAESAFQEATRE